MGMQTDVMSYHNTTSGLAVDYRTRLKGILVSPTTTGVFNVSYCDNITQNGTYNVPGTTVCTVTIASHGLANGDRVYLRFTSGTSLSESYEVSNVTTNTFTVTVASATTSGNVTMYPKILAEIDCATGTSFYTLVPGQGILATVGIYVGIPSATISSTIFYG